MIAPATAPEDILDRVVNDEGYFGLLVLDDIEPDLQGLRVAFRKLSRIDNQGFEES